MHTFSRNDFLSPAVQFAPVYGWYWNAPVNETEMRRQLQEMRDNHIRAFYVLPLPRDFIPDKMPTTMEPEYLSDEFMRLHRVIAEIAEEYGMSMWLYDEGGWPSGSACTQVNQAKSGLGRKVMDLTTFGLDAGECYYPPVSHADFLAAFVKIGDADPVRICEPFTPDCTITVTEYRWHELTTPLGRTYNTDLCDPEVGRLFLELTHDKYQKALGDKFGSLIPLMFDDEPHISYPHTWTPHMDKLFQERYGYDMLDFLPWICKELPIETEAQRQAFIDYRLLITERVLSSYFLPIREWCEKHNIASAGHLGGEHVFDLLITRVYSYGNPMEILRSFHIPGVDVIWGQIYPGNTMDTPHIPDKACVPFFPRLASSAAAQTGRLLSLTESMGVYGDGTTPDITRYVIGYQAVRGINYYNLFGLAYGKEELYALGERPVFDPHKPGYRHHLPVINKYLERLTYLTQSGPTDTHAALYLPVNDLLVDVSPQNYYDLGNALEAAHIDFDIIDDALIRKAKIENGCLCAGMRAYSRIYIPEDARLPEDVAEKIAPFTTGDVAPVFTCEGGMLRGQKRIMEDGSAVYLIFNEDDKTAENVVHIADTRPAYRLDLESGKIYAAPGRDHAITLPSGDIAAFLCTDAPIATDEPTGETKWELALNEFTIARTHQFNIVPAGLSATYLNEEPKAVELGAWRPLYGHEFSGEAVYTCEIDLPEAPLASDRYELDLGKIEYTADVTINGRPVGIAALTPFVLPLTGEQLAQHSVIEIKVANTAANQCVTVDFRAFWPNPIPGGLYHDRCLLLERKHMGGGLYGPVVLRKK